jgi:Tol biopolymer transport system component
VAPDGHRLAFCAKQGDRTRLHVLNADGTGGSVLAASLAVGGRPAWAPDGRTIAIAAEDGGGQRLFAVPLDGGLPRRLTNEYAADPAWSPDGRLIVYSGPDVGTRFPVAAVTAEGQDRAIPSITLTRGARRLRFLPGGHQLVLLRGDIQHKDIWTVDLDTGAERALISLPRDFHVRDFDVSPDGREIVVERVQEQADIVLMELPRR